MKRRISILLALAALGAAGVIAASSPAAASSSAPVRLTFDKSAVAQGVWQGTVEGDVSGSLTTELEGLRISGPIWHVTFDWIISAGASSFTARLYGILNTNTGAVVMNGTVVDGYLLGAQVHEEGQLVDLTTLQFVGSIRLMPATA